MRAKWVAACSVTWAVVTGERSASGSVKALRSRSSLAGLQQVVEGQF